jgi:hypothetical protein
MLVLHAIVPVLHLPERDGGAERCVVAFDSGLMGRAALKGERVGEPMAVDGLCEKPSGGLLGPGGREPQGQRRAGFIHRPIPSVPWALHLDGRRVQPPAEPDRALAALNRLRQLRTIWAHPPLDRRVSHGAPAFAQAGCDMARAQRLGQLPAVPHQNDLGGEMRPCATERQRRSPS